MNKIRIIAEIGINHGGLFDTARDLISAASASGASGVKFQYRNLDNAYAFNATQIGDEILYKEITKNYLSPSQILRLLGHGKQLGMEVGTSFFDIADMDDFGANLADFDFFKVPSVELNNVPLVKRMMGEGKLVLISTGCHSESEIVEALSNLQGDNWIALHCVSNYPVVPFNAKLGYLKHLAKRWRREIGYSSHDEYWEVCLLAMLMGVSVIERHITFDKAAQGLDHTTSSTPDEFGRMVMFAESLGLIVAGEGPRVPNQGEMLNLQNLGRSFYVTEDIDVGEIVREEKLVFRAPRTGMGRRELSQYQGRPAMRPVRKGAVINRSVFEKKPRLADEIVAIAISKRIALPVRFHDQHDIQNQFPIGCYEFHLSFGDVHACLDGKTYESNNRYSIHLPDYVSSTELMDPFATDASQRTASRDILERTVDFAKALQDRTGADVPVVGSFSIVHNSLPEFYEAYAQLLGAYRDHGVSILPQWLPPIAWYFGGSVRLNAVNNRCDVELIKKHHLPICMDVCHLFMGECAFDLSAAEVLEELHANIQHLHVADAKGIDGEGLPFGDGDTKNLPVLRTALGMDCMKVIEVWQGHLDNGAGFAQALTKVWELFNDVR